ncbi:MAG: type II and III secretion system protein family protein [Terriglobales bacterium]
MSRRKIRLLRALVHGILMALGVLALTSLHVALAQGPAATAQGASQSRLEMNPLALGLQQQLVLTNRLARGEAAPRTVVLPPRAPLALAAGAAEVTPGWSGGVNPLALLAALRQQSAGPQPEALGVEWLPPAPVKHSLEAVAALFGGAAGEAAEATAGPAPKAAPEAAVWATPAVGPAVDLDVRTHHSLLVESRQPLTRVSITDDSIAQAIVVSPHQVLVQGKAPGEVSLLLWNVSDARAYTVRVQLDSQPLQQELNRLYPGDKLNVSPSGDALVVSGTLPNQATAKQVLTVAQGFSPHVISDLEVDTPSDPEQVLLQVRFAEIDRSAVAQFGASLLSTGAGKTVGAISTNQFASTSSVIAPGGASQSSGGGSTVAGSGSNSAKFSLGSLLNVFLFRSDANLGLTLQALEQRNLLQILAAPNLVAMDGKEASFLAGGEFPFPVVQGEGAINNVTIQFKPFGVDLHFKPTILPDGTIDLQVSPEVSELDFSNALTLSGFVIPALSTRRASTELELRDGQSFVIAGLMDNELTKNVSKIPGLGDIPILGKFFTSHSTNNSRAELMVVVTAHLVKAQSTPPAKLKMPEPFLNSSRFDKGGGR